MKKYHTSPRAEKELTESNMISTRVQNQIRKAKLWNLTHGEAVQVVSESRGVLFEAPARKPAENPREALLEEGV